MLAYVLSDDLIFISKISGHARDLGIRVRSAKSPESLLALFRAEPSACVFVDIHLPGLAIDSFVQDLQAHDPPPRIVAYGSHVDAPALKSARAAGCDPVMPRSQFVEELPKRLREWAGQAK